MLLAVMQKKTVTSTEIFTKKSNTVKPPLLNHLKDLKDQTKQNQ